MAQPPGLLAPVRDVVGDEDNAVRVVESESSTTVVQEQQQVVPVVERIIEAPPVQQQQVATVIIAQVPITIPLANTAAPTTVTSTTATVSTTGITAVPVLTAVDADKPHHESFMHKLKHAVGMDTHHHDDDTVLVQPVVAIPPPGTVQFEQQTSSHPHHHHRHHRHHHQHHGSSKNASSSDEDVPEKQTKTSKVALVTAAGASLVGTVADLAGKAIAATGDGNEANQKNRLERLAEHAKETAEHAERLNTAEMEGDASKIDKSHETTKMVSGIVGMIRGGKDTYEAQPEKQHYTPATNEHSQTYQLIRSEDDYLRNQRDSLGKKIKRKVKAVFASKDADTVVSSEEDEVGSDKECQFPESDQPEANAHFGQDLETMYGGGGKIIIPFARREFVGEDNSGMVLAAQTHKEKKKHHHFKMFHRHHHDKPEKHSSAAPDTATVVTTTTTQQTTTTIDPIRGRERDNLYGAAEEEKTFVQTTAAVAGPSHRRTVRANDDAAAYYDDVALERSAARAQQQLVDQQAQAVVPATLVMSQPNTATASSLLLERFDSIPCEVDEGKRRLVLNNANIAEASTADLRAFSPQPSVITTTLIEDDVSLRRDTMTPSPTPFAHQRPPTPTSTSLVGRVRDKVSNALHHNRERSSSKGSKHGKSSPSSRTSSASRPGSATAPGEAVVVATEKVLVTETTTTSSPAAVMSGSRQRSISTSSSSSVSSNDRENTKQHTTAAALGGSPVPTQKRLKKKKDKKPKPAKPAEYILTDTSLYGVKDVEERQKIEQPASLQVQRAEQVFVAAPEPEIVVATEAPVAIVEHSSEVKFNRPSLAERISDGIGNMSERLMTKKKPTSPTPAVVTATSVDVVEERQRRRDESISTSSSSSEEDGENNRRRMQQPTTTTTVTEQTMTLTETHPIRGRNIVRNNEDDFVDDERRRRVPVEDEFVRQSSRPQMVIMSQSPPRASNVVVSEITNVRDDNRNRRRQAPATPVVVAVRDQNLYREKDVEPFDAETARRADDRSYRDDDYEPRDRSMPGRVHNVDILERPVNQAERIRSQVIVSEVDSPRLDDRIRQPPQRDVERVEQYETTVIQRRSSTSSVSTEDERGMRVRRKKNKQQPRRQQGPSFVSSNSRPGQQQQQQVYEREQPQKTRRQQSSSEQPEAVVMYDQSLYRDKDLETSPSYRDEEVTPYRPVLRDQTSRTSVDVKDAPYGVVLERAPYSDDEEPNARPVGVDERMRRDISVNQEMLERNQPLPPQQRVRSYEEERTTTVVQQRRSPSSSSSVSTDDAELGVRIRRKKNKQQQQQQPRQQGPSFVERMKAAVSPKSRPEQQQTRQQSSVPEAVVMYDQSLYRDKDLETSPSYREEEKAVTTTYRYPERDDDRRVLREQTSRTSADVDVKDAPYGVVLERAPYSDDEEPNVRPIGMDERMRRDISVNEEMLERDQQPPPPQQRVRRYEETTAVQQQRRSPSSSSSVSTDDAELGVRIRRKKNQPRQAAMTTTTTKKPVVAVVELDQSLYRDKDVESMAAASSVSDVSRPMEQQPLQQQTSVASTVTDYKDEPFGVVMERAPYSDDEEPHNKPLMSRIRDAAGRMTTPTHDQRQREIDDAVSVGNVFGPGSRQVSQQLSVEERASLPSDDDEYDAGRATPTRDTTTTTTTTQAFYSASENEAPLPEDEAVPVRTTTPSFGSRLFGGLKNALHLSGSNAAAPSQQQQQQRDEVAVVPTRQRRRSSSASSESTDDGLGGRTRRKKYLSSSQHDDNTTPVAAAAPIVLERGLYFDKEVEDVDRLEPKPLTRTRRNDNDVVVVSPMYSQQNSYMSTASSIGPYVPPTNVVYSDEAYRGDDDEPNAQRQRNRAEMYQTPQHSVMSLASEGGYAGNMFLERQESTDTLGRGSTPVRGTTSPKVARNDSYDDSPVLTTTRQPQVMYAGDDYSPRRRYDEVERPQRGGVEYVQQVSTQIEPVLIVDTDKSYRVDDREPHNRPLTERILHAVAPARPMMDENERMRDIRSEISVNEEMLQREPVRVSRHEVTTAVVERRSPSSSSVSTDDERGVRIRRKKIKLPPRQQQGGPSFVERMKDAVTSKFSRPEQQLQQQQQQVVYERQPTQPEAVIMYDQSLYRDKDVEQQPSSFDVVAQPDRSYRDDDNEPHNRPLRERIVHAVAPARPMMDENERMRDIRSEISVNEEMLEREPVRVSRHEVTTTTVEQRRSPSSSSSVSTDDAELGVRIRRKKVKQPRQNKPARPEAVIMYDQSLYRDKDVESVAPAPTSPSYHEVTTYRKPERDRVLLSQPSVTSTTTDADVKDAPYGTVLERAPYSDDEEPHDKPLMSRIRDAAGRLTTPSSSHEQRQRELDSQVSVGNVFGDRQLSQQLSVEDGGEVTPTRPRSPVILAQEYDAVVPPPKAEHTYTIIDSEHREMFPPSEQQTPSLGTRLMDSVKGVVANVEEKLHMNKPAATTTTETTTVVAQQQNIIERRSSSSSSSDNEPEIVGSSATKQQKVKKAKKPKGPSLMGRLKGLVQRDNSNKPSVDVVDNVENNKNSAAYREMAAPAAAVLAADGGLYEASRPFERQVTTERTYTTTVAGPVPLDVVAQPDRSYRDDDNEPHNRPLAERIIHAVTPARPMMDDAERMRDIRSEISVNDEMLQREPQRVSRHEVTTTTVTQRRSPSSSSVSTDDAELGVRIRRKKVKQPRNQQQSPSFVERMKDAVTSKFSRPEQQPQQQQQQVVYERQSVQPEAVVVYDQSLYRDKDVEQQPSSFDVVAQPDRSYRDDDNEPHNRPLRERIVHAVAPARPMMDENERMRDIRSEISVNDEMLQREPVRVSRHEVTTAVVQRRSLSSSSVSTDDAELGVRIRRKKIKPPRTQGPSMVERIKEGVRDAAEAVTSKLRPEHQQAEKLPESKAIVVRKVEETTTTVVPLDSVAQPDKAYRDDDNEPHNRPLTERIRNTFATTSYPEDQNERLREIRTTVSIDDDKLSGERPLQRVPSSTTQPTVVSKYQQETQYVVQDDVKPVAVSRYKEVPPVAEVSRETLQESIVERRRPSISSSSSSSSDDERKVVEQDRTLIRTQKSETTPIMTMTPAVTATKTTKIITERREQVIIPVVQPEISQREMMPASSVGVRQRMAAFESPAVSVTQQQQQRAISNASSSSSSASADTVEKYQIENKQRDYATTAVVPGGRQLPRAANAYLASVEASKQPFPAAAPATVVIDREAIATRYVPEEPPTPKLVSSSSSAQYSVKMPEPEEIKRKQIATSSFERPDDREEIVDRERISERELSEAAVPVVVATTTTKSVTTSSVEVTEPTSAARPAFLSTGSNVSEKLKMFGGNNKAGVTNYVKPVRETAPPVRTKQVEHLREAFIEQKVPSRTEDEKNRRDVKKADRSTSTSSSSSSSRSSSSDNVRVTSTETTFNQHEAKVLPPKEIIVHREAIIEQKIPDTDYGYDRKPPPPQKMTTMPVTNITAYTDTNERPTSPRARPGGVKSVVERFEQQRRSSSSSERTPAAPVEKSYAVVGLKSGRTPQQHLPHVSHGVGKASTWYDDTNTEETARAQPALHTSAARRASTEMDRTTVVVQQQRNRPVHQRTFEHLPPITNNNSGGLQGTSLKHHQGGPDHQQHNNRRGPIVVEGVTLGGSHINTTAAGGGDHSNTTSVLNVGSLKHQSEQHQPRSTSRTTLSSTPRGATPPPEHVASHLHAVAVAAGVEKPSAREHNRIVESAELHKAVYDRETGQVRQVPLHHGAPPVSGSTVIVGRGGNGGNDDDNKPVSASSPYRRIPPAETSMDDMPVLTNSGRHEGKNRSHSEYRVVVRDGGAGAERSASRGRAVSTTTPGRVSDLVAPPHRRFYRNVPEREQDQYQPRRPASASALTHIPRSRRLQQQQQQYQPTVDNEFHYYPSTSYYSNTTDADNGRARAYSQQQQTIQLPLNLQQQQPRADTASTTNSTARTHRVRSVDRHFRIGRLGPSSNSDINTQQSYDQQKRAKPDFHHQILVTSPRPEAAVQEQQQPYHQRSYNPSVQQPRVREIETIIKRYEPAPSTILGVQRRSNAAQQQPQQNDPPLVTRTVTEQYEYNVRRNVIGRSTNGGVGGGAGGGSNGFSSSYYIPPTAITTAKRATDFDSLALTGKSYVNDSRQQRVVKKVPIATHDDDENIDADANFNSTPVYVSSYNHSFNNNNSNNTKTPSPTVDERHMLARHGHHSPSAAAANDFNTMKSAATSYYVKQEHAGGRGGGSGGEKRLHTDFPATLEQQEQQRHSPSSYGRSTPTGTGRSHSTRPGYTRFSWAHQGARDVRVTGDFNDWDVHGIKLHPANDGTGFEADIELAPGIYEYKYVVDGHAVHDPDREYRYKYAGAHNVMVVQ